MLPVVLRLSLKVLVLLMMFQSIWSTSAQYAQSTYSRMGQQYFNFHEAADNAPGFLALLHCDDCDTAHSAADGGWDETDPTTKKTPFKLITVQLPRGHFIDHYLLDYQSTLGREIFRPKWLRLA